jgi:hypothetical protein
MVNAQSGWINETNFTPYEPLMCAVLLVVGVVVGALVVKREQKVDIL